MIKHLVFDLDGTLADTLPEIHATTDLFAQKHGHRRPTLQETRHGIGQGGRALLSYIFGFPEASAELQKAYLEFLTIYDQVSGTLALTYPGVDEFLGSWTGGISIITNKPGLPAQKVLKYTGLDRYAWAAFIHGESYARKKPDPLPFEECFREVGVKAHEVLVIGDSDADVLGAKAVGARSLAVSFGYTDLDELQELRPDGILHSYSQLSTEIERISQLGS